jgi:hypothetical protein
MFDPQSHQKLKQEISSCIAADAGVLKHLREEIRPLKTATRKIQPRATTSLSLVGADGGNNQLQFDPYLIQLIRVVDSSNNEYVLEAVSPTSDIGKLSARQFDSAGTPASRLGELMHFLGVKTLPQLSHMIRPRGPEKLLSPSWVQVYRSLVEWAILFWLIRTKDFGTDTLIVFDGLLRSKVFAGDLFPRMLDGMKQAIEDKWAKQKRRIYLVGVAKHSKVLDRYRLAMALEDVLRTDYPAFVEVPRDVEEKAYAWQEFARGADSEEVGKEANKFVGGKMFLVKFGNSSRDPVWPVDIFEAQKSDAQIILGSLLADAINGFPVPLYPQCLQKAHENAALVDFDFDVLQDHIFEGVRASLGAQGTVLDVFQLQEDDPAQRRYG